MQEGLGPGFLFSSAFFPCFFFFFDVLFLTSLVGVIWCLGEGRGDVGGPVF